MSGRFRTLGMVHRDRGAGIGNANGEFVEVPRGIAWSWWIFSAPTVSPQA
jgi:hypothetical protein